MYILDVKVEVMLSNFRLGRHHSMWIYYLDWYGAPFLLLKPWFLIGLEGDEL